MKLTTQSSWNEVKRDRYQSNVRNLGGFHPVVCKWNSVLYLTVVTQQCGAMFSLCNYQLSDMFRPYRAIIRLYKIMVIRQGTCGSTACTCIWLIFYLKINDMVLSIYLDILNYSVNMSDCIASKGEMTGNRELETYGKNLSWPVIRNIQAVVSRYWEQAVLPHVPCLITIILYSLMMAL